MMKILTLLAVMFLAACSGVQIQQSNLNHPLAGVDWFDERTDFVTTHRRADIESDASFNFRVTYFESNYKKYLAEPYRSVFKIYVDGTATERGASSEIVMCSSTEICVFEARRGRGGYYDNEVYRTEFTLKDGSLDFTVPSEFIPKNTDFPRGGVLLWAFMDIDSTLWRVTINNSPNAIEVPSSPKERFPPEYIQYRNYLELI